MIEAFRILEYDYTVVVACAFFRIVDQRSRLAYASGFNGHRVDPSQCSHVILDPGSRQSGKSILHHGGKE